MNNSLTIRLGEKLAHALNEEARRTGSSREEIARRAIESHLNRGGKFAVMQRILE